MAVSGGLNHDGADERVAGAPPDPAEGNGAPDDGFARAAWCENVTYSTGFPESQVAQKIYDQWHRSAAHNGCMTNANKNVGAVGIYYDGSTWWATFIAEVDSTPPGPAAAPARTSQPVADKPSSPTKEAAAVAPVGQPALPTTVAGSDETTVAPPSTQPGTDTDVVLGDEPVADKPTISDPPGPRYVVNAQPTLSGLVRRARRRQLPTDGPAEIALLAGVALVAYRRLEGRTRTRISRPVVDLRPRAVEAAAAEIDFRAA